MKKIGIISGMLLIVLGTLLYFNSPPGSMRDGILNIRSGDGARQVASRLVRERMIRNGSLFLMLHFLHGRPYLYAGSYRINGGMTAWEVLRRVTSFNSTLVRITIPEGYTMEQIALKLEDGGVTGADRFLALCTDRSFLAKRGIPAPTAEGYLFPDTYLFAPGASPEQVFAVLHEQMISRMKEFVTPSYGGLSRHGLLTLASLIEKEAKLPEERSRIASVYHNRLKRGMKLDCDPTVRYALNKHRGRLTFRDLECESPFNTYRVRGLPPTPICSPGREAILAAMFPESTPYLFFVVHKNGSHYFSATLREHMKAVDRYRKGRGN